MVGRRLGTSDLGEEVGACRVVVGDGAAAAAAVGGDGC